ncbi:MAG: trypsin-like serine protease [Actinomycetota bacterium]
MRRSLAISAVMLALVLAAGSAQAITFGTVDENNRFDNVGALVGDFPGVGRRVICSGTLISEDVFLTATHCVVALEANGSTQTYVSFAPQFSPTDSAAHLPGTAFGHPDYNHDMADLHDIGVVVLDEAVEGIEPAELADAGYLQARKSTLKSQRFTTVGYGQVRDTKTGGPNSLFPGGGIRRFTTQGFLSLQKSWLTLSMNPSTGSGGTCFGDSGGPHFHRGILVSITITGDSVCRATDTTYRVDTASARAFLDDFVALP